MKKRIAFICCIFNQRKRLANSPWQHYTCEMVACKQEEQRKSMEGHKNEFESTNKKNRQIEKVFRNRACHNNILEIFITFNWKIWRRFFFDTAATAKTAKRGESEK